MASRSSTPRGNPADPEVVRDMFDRIAPRYDRMNTLMTAGLDAGWRRATIDAAALARGMRVLDLACGTGLLARAAASAVGPSGAVVGRDASQAMIERAGARGTAPGSAPITWERGDAMRSGREGWADAVLIGFGLRNLPDYAGALEEMVRVARPGGRVVVLEIARPRAALPRLVHASWFRHVVPLLGRIAGTADAYAYLPASLDNYPSPEAVAELMAGSGMRAIRWRWLRGGMTTLHVGVRGDG